MIFLSLSVVKTVYSYRHAIIIVILTKYLTLSTPSYAKLAALDRSLNSPAITTTTITVKLIAVNSTIITADL